MVLGRFVNKRGAIIESSIYIIIDWSEGRLKKETPPATLNHSPPFPL